MIDGRNKRQTITNKRFITFVFTNMNCDEHC